MTQNKTIRILVLGAALVAQAVCAETCITSGDVAAVAKAGSASAVTPAVALVTGRLAASVASSALDIRDWTRVETPGIALKTTPPRGVLFIIR